MKNQNNCCLDLFADFTFEEISHADPPKDKKGVYCVRIQKRGISCEEIENLLASHISRLHWEMVEKYLIKRIHRLDSITDCPIIYIGGAGTKMNSKHTLVGRYKDLSMRHTAQFPIWALLYYGWELEYGWKISDNPAETEKQLKVQYQARHGGKLPALVVS